MPSRRKPDERQVKLSIASSLREYGLDIRRPGPHSTFHRKISTQVVRQCLERSDPVHILVGKVIPANRMEAIESVYAAEMFDYLIQETFDKRATIVDDMLESELKDGDDPSRILQWPPFYLHRSNGVRVKKPDYSRFSTERLDPLKRFTLRRPIITPDQLVFEDFNQEGILLGYAFEAMVASHAVHKLKCFRCKSSGSLSYSGGSDTSWRDMYCTRCQSCYEIKSKRDIHVINKVFKYQSLQGGSYRKWCEEDFAERVEGTDYVVIVSREPTELGWPVDIAEIATVLPVAVGLTFAEASKDVISVKTRVTLKNRQQWFCVPGKDLPDLGAISRSAYQQVFPNRWSENGGQRSSQNQPTSIDEIAAELARVSIGIWDDN